jgi:hypothetical protein
MLAVIHGAGMKVAPLQIPAVRVSMMAGVRVEPGLPTSTRISVTVERNHRPSAYLAEGL